MSKEAEELLLAIADFLLYPHKLAPADSQEYRNNLAFCAAAFEKSIK